MEVQFLKNILVIFLVLINNAYSDENIVDLRMKSNQINLGIRSVPSNLDPIVAATGHEIVYFQAVYQTLIRAGENGDLSPSLAKKWEFKSNGKEVHFYLDNAYFHDGSMVTADDVIYSLSRHLWNGSKSLDRDILRNLIEGGHVNGKELPKGLVRLSSKKFAIRLNAPYPGFLSLLSMAGMSILSKKNLEKGNFVGSGPFIQTKSKSELIQYSKFNLEKIPLKKLNFISYNSESGVKEMISSKNVDVIYLGMGNYKKETINVQGFEVYTMDSPAFLHMFVNSTKGVLGNKEKRSVLKGLLLNFAKNSKKKSANHQPIPYLIPKGLLPLNYYNKKTATLVPEDVKGVLKSNEVYEILYSVNSFSEDFINELQSYLALAGIKTKTRKLSHKQYIDELLDKKSGDLIFGGYGADFPDIDGIVPPIFGTNGWHFGDYDLSHYIKEIGKVKFISSQEERLKGYTTVIQDFESQNLVFPFFSNRVRVLVRKGVSIPPPNYRYESELWKIFWNH